MATDLFDLHIKISRTNAGDYCAKTVLGTGVINNTLMLEKFNPRLTYAICNLVVDMEHAGVWPTLETTPSLSVWPFGTVGKVIPAAVPTSKPASKPPSKPVAVTTKKKQVPQTLKRPVDLTSVHFPDCKAVCQAYDLFGHSKCRSLCQSKKRA